MIKELKRKIKKFFKGVEYIETIYFINETEEQVNRIIRDLRVNDFIVGRIENKGKTIAAKIYKRL